MEMEVKINQQKYLCVSEILRVVLTCINVCYRMYQRTMQFRILFSYTKIEQSYIRLTLIKKGSKLSYKMKGPSQTTYAEIFEFLYHSPLHGFWKTPSESTHIKSFDVCVDEEDSNVTKFFKYGSDVSYFFRRSP